MKSFLFACLLLFTALLSGCQLTGEAADHETVFAAKVGVLLADTGLGDESFNDAAFTGLTRARDELNILFDYREAPEGNYEEMLRELAEEENDLVIGLGFSVQEAVEAVAADYPDQAFLLIDGQSDVANVHSMTFKEHEGSFLVGMVAALTTESNTLGFIGGVDAPVIHRFEAGFSAGAHYVNPDIEILTDYAGSFGDDDLGASLAEKQIEQGADFIYPAAGFTGVGSILKAQEEGVYAAGVDSDQFFVAEEAVVTSMLKNIDIAIFDLLSSVADGEELEESYELGLAEQGLGLAEIRLVQLNQNGQASIMDATKKISSGDLVVPESVEE